MLSVLQNVTQKFQNVTIMTMMRKLRVLATIAVVLLMMKLENLTNFGTGLVKMEQFAPLQHSVVSKVNRMFFLGKFKTLQK
jgi:hypothetical protein